VLVAFVVGGIELVQVLSIELNLSGPVWSWFNNMDFETMGFAIVGVFVVTWVTSYAIWKRKKYEQYPSSLVGAPRFR